MPLVITVKRGGKFRLRMPDGTAATITVERATGTSWRAKVGVDAPKTIAVVRIDEHGQEIRKPAIAST